MYINDGRKIRSDCEEERARTLAPWFHKKMLLLYMILMGLEFQVKERGNKGFVKNEAMSS